MRTNVYHKYIKDLKLNITIDLDGFIYTNHQADVASTVDS